jgi:plastocyanin
MNNPLAVVTTAIGTAVVTMLIGPNANQDLTDKPAVQDAVVNFGAPHPQPAPPAHHVLVPNEVTILKGGTVTFVMNGLGHGVAIYPVSKNTTRAHIAQDLCTAGPAQCAEDRAGINQFLVTDGDGRLVIDTGTNPPERFINYTPGQLLSAGAGTGVALVGSALRDDGTRTLGTEVKYRFLEDGRYLVICTNRPHTINDWMFGFVNVV